LSDASSFRSSAAGREIRRESRFAATSGEESLDGWTKIDFVERLNRLRGKAYGELVPGPVEDHPPLREERDLHAVLPGPPVADPLDAENLDVERPEDNENIDPRQHAEDDPGAGVHFTRMILSVFGSTMPS